MDKKAIMAKCICPICQDVKTVPLGEFEKLTCPKCQVKMIDKLYFDANMQVILRK